MDEIRKKRLQMATQALMAAHDDLVDLMPAKKKKPSEEDGMFADAMDSLEECIDCLSELLEAE